MPLTICPHDMEPRYSVYGRDSGRPVRFGPFTVHLVHDELSECPWQDWPDGLVPVAYVAGRDGLTVFDLGDGIESPFEAMSDGQISRHWRGICDALDYDRAAHNEEAKRDRATWGGDLAEHRRDLFRDFLAGIKSESLRCYLDALQAVWNIAGAHALRIGLNGYSQGDHLDALLVYNRNTAERHGNPWPLRHDVAADLESEAELLRSWAFGDVWGFIVEDQDGGHVDSCFGFYGCYFDGDPGGGGYVLTQAAEAVETALHNAMEVAANAEHAARGDFRDLRREWRDARARAGGLTGGAICKALESEARRLVARWRDARNTYRTCAAALA